MGYRAGANSSASKKRRQTLTETAKVVDRQDLIDRSDKSKSDCLLVTYRSRNLESLA